MHLLTLGLFLAALMTAHAREWPREGGGLAGNTRQPTAVFPARGGDAAAKEGFDLMHSYGRVVETLLPKILLSIVFISLGGACCLFGNRMTKHVYAVAGAIVGFWRGLLVEKAIAAKGLTVIICRAVSGTLALFLIYFGLRSWRVAVYIMGGAAGYIAGTFLLPFCGFLAEYYWFRVVVLLDGTILGIVFMSAWEKIIFAVATSLVGATLALYGAEYVLDTTFQDRVKDVLRGKGIDGDQIYWMLAKIVAMAALGIIVQLRHDRRKQQESTSSSPSSRPQGSSVAAREVRGSRTNDNMYVV